MRFHAVAETFVVPVTFVVFRSYAETIAMGEDFIIDKWLELPVWGGQEQRPGIRRLIVVRRV